MESKVLESCVDCSMTPPTGPTLRAACFPGPTHPPTRSRMCRLKTTGGFRLEENCSSRGGAVRFRATALASLAAG